MFYSSGRSSSSDTRGRAVVLSISTTDSAAGTKLPCAEDIHRHADIQYNSTSPSVTLLLYSSSMNN